MKKGFIILSVMLLLITGCFNGSSRKDDNSKYQQFFSVLEELQKAYSSEKRASGQILEGVFVTVGTEIKFYKLDYLLFTMNDSQKFALADELATSSNAGKVAYMVFGVKALSFKDLTDGKNFNTATLPLANSVISPTSLVKDIASGKNINADGSVSTVTPSDNWPLTLPVFGSDSVPLANISSPTTTIDTKDKTDAQVVTELQTALNKGGVIVFNTHGVSKTIKLIKQLYIPVQGTAANSYSSPVVIDGGNLITLDGGRDANGSGGTRILEKAWKVNLTVQRMAFANANAANATSGRADDSKSGGAINVENWDGSLTVIDCTFTNCHTIGTGPDVGGGAVRCPGQTHVYFSNCTFSQCTASNGGAINSLGSELWLLNCKFSACKATGTGGGAEVGAGGQGGIGGAVYIDGISNNSSNAVLRVEKSTFTDNTSNEFGGAIFLYTYENSGSKTLIKESTFHNNVINGTTGFGGALYSQNGALNIVSSTFDENRSASMGGAIWFLSTETAKIVNSTFSKNKSTNFGSALQLNGPVYISSCTLADNECLGPYGGAIRSGTKDSTWLKNTILANNKCQNSDIGNVSDTYQDGGGNYQWPYSATQKKAVTAITFSNPFLGDLANNGGLTLTRKPGTESATINGGVDFQCVTVDQCGNTRTETCDAGAVESK